MTLSRRSFVGSLALGTLGVAGSPALLRRQAFAAPSYGLLEHELDMLPHGIATGAIRLNTNENPHGPSPKSIEAVQAMLPNAGRYPSPLDPEAREALAEHHGVSADHILLGAGSAEILKMATYAFTSPTAALVTGSPTYGDPAVHAAAIGSPVHAVLVDPELRLNLDEMATRSAGAGMVFLCNPNNPTGTVHSGEVVKDFITTVLRRSPETKILVDEAYHEFVEDPAYESAVPIAMENPNVFVVRTFSKIHGMAGMRLGYAIGRPELLSAMRQYRLGNGVNSPVLVAGIESARDTENLAKQRRMNAEARTFLTNALTGAGFSIPASNTNFIFFEIDRDVRTFIEACRERDVLVGRPFPPLDTHARISIGTMDELRRATPVILDVLRAG